MVSWLTSSSYSGVQRCQMGTQLEGQIGQVLKDVLSLFIQPEQSDF